MFRDLSRDLVGSDRIFDSLYKKLAIDIEDLASFTGFLNPKYAPTMQSGTESKNHIEISANIVENGTAPEEFAPIKKKFKIKNIPKVELNKMELQIQLI